MHYKHDVNKFLTTTSVSSIAFDNITKEHNRMNNKFVIQRTNEISDYQIIY